MAVKLLVVVVGVLMLCELVGGYQHFRVNILLLCLVEMEVICSSKMLLLTDKSTKHHNPDHHHQPGKCYLSFCCYCSYNSSPYDLQCIAYSIQHVPAQYTHIVTI
jgi:hypothetical protein